MADIVLNRVTHIEFPDNIEIDIGRIQIESGSLLLEEILCDDGIVFGETNATRFEATVYNLVDVSGLKMRVYQTDIDGNHRRNLFEGYVDSCKQDRDGYYRKLVAYDAFYSIGNSNVAGWWFQFWNTRETATLKELRESLCDWVGIRYSTSVTFHNDGFVCSKTATLSSVSFNTLLRWICEIQCTIPHIDRDGVLQFISLANYSIIDISDAYERNTSEFEGFNTATIDAVEIYDYDSNLIATTDTTGAVSPKNIYTIKDNSLLFGLAAEDAASSASAFAHNYLAQINSISYTPCTINMIVSDLDLALGDYIQADHVTSIILHNTLSGNLFVEQEIQATGNEYLHDTNKTPTAEVLSLQRRTDELRDEIITDDLLNYSYTNDEEYIIENVVTPIISVEIAMPKSSNLVFLATVNLESVCTETREVRETVTINSEACEVVRTEKVPVIVESFFEWNGAEILSNKPTETYSEDGKHLMNLMFFSIGGRQIGGNVTFKVFIKAKHGHIYIGENQVNATIISKGSSVGNLPWDGTISVTEELSAIKISHRSSNIGNVTGIVGTESQTPTTPPDDVEIIESIRISKPQIRIGDIDDSVETSTTS
jgi:hypothetical protein